MKKIVSVGFILIIGLIGLLFIPQKSKNSFPTNKKIQNTIVVSEVITSQQQNKKFDTIQIQQGETALDLLNETATSKTNGTGKNAFVTEINGRKVDDSKKEFWAFYVNGKQAQVGAGSYIVQPHDTIEWKIETY